MSAAIQSPYHPFQDIDGSPLRSGYIFIGEAGLEPESAPIEIYWDEALTINVSQPIRTLNGFPSNNGTPSMIYTNTPRHSIKVQNKNQSIVFYELNNRAMTDAGVVSYSGGDILRTLSDIELDRANVKNYPTIADCIDHARERLQSGNGPEFGGGVYTGTAPVIYFPSGIYSIENAISNDVDNNLAYFRFIGDNAIIVQNEPTENIFGGVGYQTSFHGLTLKGGAKAISIKTGNIDTARINIGGCEFGGQYESSIATDSASYSTVLNIGTSKFYNTGTADHTFYFGSGDTINVTDSWITNRSACCIHNNAVLNMNRILGVPGGDQNLADTGRWVDNYQTFNARNVRFGGEGGGSTIVHNYINGLDDTAWPHYQTGAITIRDCPVYATNKGVIHAYNGLPSLIIIDSVSTPIDTQYIIDKQTGTSLVDQIAAYEASGSKSQFSVSITSKVDRSTSIAETALLNALSPYLYYTHSTGSDYAIEHVIPSVNTRAVVSGVVTTKAALGESYAVTSTEPNVAIIDTGIFAGSEHGFKGGGIYDVFVTANTNSGASSLYRSVHHGVMMVSVRYFAPNVSYNCRYVTQNDLAGSFGTGITVGGVLFDSVESTAFPTSADPQIRIKVSGMQAGYESTYITVRIKARF